MTAAGDVLSGRRPEWLAHRYDAAQDAFHFVWADRALRLREPFLSAKALEALPPQVARRTDLSFAGAHAAPVHFIFHSAYCGSTLLANLFDCEGVACALKEPHLLNDLVGWRQRGGDPEAVLRVLDLALALLASPFVAGESVVIKPSNVCNGFCAPMLKARPQAKAILLYAPLRVYLASIARKGLWSRRWARELLVRQLADGLIGFGLTIEDHLQHSDLEAAAIGWLAQHQLFCALARRWPDRVRLLDSESLVAGGAEGLLKAARFYGVAMPDDAARRQTALHGSKNAKDGSPFGAGERAKNTSAVLGRQGEEIDMIVAWAEKTAEFAGLPPRAPLPLFDLRPAGATVYR